VVGLDSRNSEAWKAPDDGPEVLRSLVEAVQQEHPVLERRVYLFGHSGGAVFALIVSLMESQYFAAAAVHAGSFRSSAEAATVELVARPIPIKMIVGDRDRFFSVESVEATAALFRDHEIPVEVEVVKGHDHWYYSKAKAFNESAWEFLSKHELAMPPRFTHHAYE
jgi:predicted esterase